MYSKKLTTITGSRFTLPWAFLPKYTQIHLSYADLETHSCPAPEITYCRPRALHIMYSSCSSERLRYEEPKGRRRESPITSEHLVPCKSESIHTTITQYHFPQSLQSDSTNPKYQAFCPPKIALRNVDGGHCDISVNSCEVERRQVLEMVERCLSRMAIWSLLDHWEQFFCFRRSCISLWIE